MPTSLDVLFVEDSPDDAALLMCELRRAGFSPKWRRVETAGEFLAALKQAPEIILADYSMPRFTGLKALELMQESGLDIPFILVSGTVGEELAVEAMRQGATDYVLKDRLARLGACVQRALKEHQIRQLAQNAMRESDRRFREMLENLQLIAMTLDEHGVVTFCNNSLGLVTGWKKEEIIGFDWFARFIPEENPELQAMFFKNVGTGQIPAHHENAIKTRTGELRQIVWNNTMLRDLAGHFIGTASIGEDVTERRKAETALRESEEKFRQLAENINEVFWITDPAKQHMIYISPAYEDIWGRTCDSLLSSPQSWLEAIHAEDRPRVMKAAAGQERGGDYDEIYRIVRPDGTVRWIHDQGFPVRSAAGEVYRVVGTAEDITKHKDLEEQFRQAQKMESIGQLAGGVAHDFNNLLAVIQMQSDLLVGTEGLSSDQAEIADEIGEAVQRAAALTRQLLLFSRREVCQPHPMDLGESITNIAKMLRRVLGENIQVQLKLPSGPLFIHADSGMVDQVLMNLSVNARDAMANGGQLTVEAAAVEFDESSAIQILQARAGSFVCLSVTDTGCGIPPEILPKIFEPFFTTKGVGKGTGLGLATVFGIVQQHEGWINVHSEVGCGTTFRIYIPRLALGEFTAASTPELARLPGGHETILLVEDDASLRLALRRALGQLGYRVLEASSGVKALDVWRQNRAEVRLLLTDLVMPEELNGKDLAARLREENPQLKVVYMSGYGAEVVGMGFNSTEAANLLAKPFQISKLARFLRERLEGRN